jgi:D-aspartate ligase
LLDTYATVSGAGIETLLVEMIPGPDSKLCSYYTYLDENSEPLFHFTKRIIRRYPVNMGGGCYHITDWIPEVQDVSLRLFKQARLRGLANAEFKRDDRDGKLKLIEVNARFTGANSLVAASGFDLARFVYNRLVGRAQEPLVTYVLGMRLWDPEADFHAFRELRRRGQLTFREWIASLMHRQVLMFFRWYDPWPTMVFQCRHARDFLARRAGRLARWIKNWHRPAAPSED